jgi:hypothetical protein
VSTRRDSKSSHISPVALLSYCAKSACFLWRSEQQASRVEVLFTKAAQTKLKSAAGVDALAEVDVVVSSGGQSAAGAAHLPLAFLERTGCLLEHIVPVDFGNFRWRDWRLTGGAKVELTRSADCGQGCGESCRSKTLLSLFCRYISSLKIAILTVKYMTPVLGWTRSWIMF